jgi:Lon protease-like protein
MMFDIANADDVFGYIHTDSNGRIASVGTMCKITERQLLEDGRQFISLEGISRFRVRKIVKTLPYVLAEVEPDLQDTIPENEAAAAKLEFEVYDALKHYMRLMKCYEPNKTLVISQAAKKSRPSVPTLNSSKRRTDFSFALANMIQMTQAKESQLMLQTTSVVKRLEAQKAILVQAAELVADQLIKMGVLTADKRDSIKTMSLNNDDDSDILPPDLSAKEEKKDKDEWDISNIE